MLLDFNGRPIRRATGFLRQYVGVREDNAEDTADAIGSRTIWPEEDDLPIIIPGVGDSRDED